MLILLTGAHGMLGKDLADTLEKRGHRLIKTDRNELDITNEKSVRDFVRDRKPEVIINAAAYNFVDKVEEPEFFEIAYAVNALGPKHLAPAAKEIGARFVHFSTDYVFAGEKPEGYVESDPRSPISKYGETKAAGEAFVEEVDGDYLICRLSKIFGRPGLSEESKESFVAIMLRLAKEKPSLSIVDEEVGSPSFTEDIALRVADMIERKASKGIYHLVNDGEGVTWFDFAEEIFSLVGIETPRKPVSSADFPKPAKRPKFAALLNTKLPPLRHRKEALADFLSSLNA